MIFACPGKLPDGIEVDDPTYFPFDGERLLGPWEHWADACAFLDFARLATPAKPGTPAKSFGLVSGIDIMGKPVMLRDCRVNQYRCTNGMRSWMATFITGWQVD